MLFCMPIGLVITVGRFLDEKKLDRWIYWLLIVMGLSVCVSEPMCRHTFKLVFFLFLIKIWKEPRCLKKLGKIKYMLISMVAFVLMQIIEAYWGGHFYDIITAYDFIFNYNMLLIPIILVCVNDKRRAENILTAVGISLLVLDGYVILQSYQGVIRPIPLMKSTIISLCVFYTVLLPAFVILAAKETQIIWRRNLYVIIAVITAIAAFFANTRALWVALAFVLLIAVSYLFRQERKKMVGLLGVTLVFLGTVCYTHPQFADRISSIGDPETHSFKERRLMWKSAFDMFMDYPVLGVGTGNYAYFYQNVYILPEAKETWANHAHSTYFQLLGENGIVGFCTYMAMILSVGALSWQYRRNPYGIMLLMSLLAYSVYVTTESTFSEYGAMRLFWLYIGLCASQLIGQESDI